MCELTPPNRKVLRRELACAGPRSRGPVAAPLRASRARRSLAVRSDRGSALAEFAIIAPVLFLVLFAILDFGRALNYWQDATHITAEGARLAAVDRCPSGSPGTTCLQNYLQSQADTQELKVGSSSVTQKLRICISFPDGTNAIDHPVKVAATFKFRWLPILKLATTTVATDSTMRLEKPSSGNAYNTSGTVCST
jgi:Flp pilus assembly protein TadG